jgi:hypothetical protein
MLSMQSSDTLAASSVPLVFGRKDLARETDLNTAPRYVALVNLDDYSDADHDLEQLLSRLQGSDDDLAIWDDQDDMDAPQLVAAIVAGRIIRLRDVAAHSAAPQAAPKHRGRKRQRVAHERAMRRKPAPAPAGKASGAGGGQSEPGQAGAEVLLGLEGRPGDPVGTDEVGDGQNFPDVRVHTAQEEAAADGADLAEQAEQRPEGVAVEGLHLVQVEDHVERAEGPEAGQ